MKTKKRYTKRKGSREGHSSTPKSDRGATFLARGASPCAFVRPKRRTRGDLGASVSIRGAIDVGSSSIKLLIANVDTTTNTIVEQVYFATYVTKLGGKLNETGRLSKESVRRSLDAFRAISDLLAYHSCSISNINVVATAALRNAQDADEFINLVYSETGIAIEVISPEMEAVYTSRGIISFIPQVFSGDTRNIIVDIGGGSTEFTSVVGSNFGNTISCHVGSVQLSNIFNMKEHHNSFPLKSVQSYIESELSELYSSEMFSQQPRNLVVTAGTIATITAIHKLGSHDYQKAVTLDVVDIQSIFEKILRTPFHKRTEIPGLSYGKQDTALAGCILLLNIVKHLRVSQVVYSPCGLKEGLIVSSV